ncbi:MAG TPA: hypothetical protein PLE60_01830 [Candidatus Latescibacteria bacterium]|nr:hypothetical protein [Candidatus Latescibacterota bacterium]
MKETDYRNDGLDRPAIRIRAHQLVSTVCWKGGVECPLLARDDAEAILARVGSDPTVSIQLTSPAERIPHYATVNPSTRSEAEKREVFDRKRDLHVLQRLGLAPNDTRRARYLYTLLFDRIPTPDGLCAFDTPGWEGCPLARSGAYERVREKGWSAIVYSRTDAEMQAYRERSAAKIASADRLFVRPHHLMCLSCWYAGGKGVGPRPNDTLYEVMVRVRENPEIPITLVEGCCMACDCCDGFHPETGRCVHDCGLIRDFKKDLDVFQKIGLMPGDTRPAREVFALIYERIPSTRDICGNGTGVVTSHEWEICGGADGNPGYEATRRTGIL